MQTTRSITRTKETFKDLFFKTNSHRELADVEFVWENADFKLLQSLTPEKDNLQALFSLLNSNRTEELTIDAHITCYASGGYGNAGAFINAKSTIWCLNTEVPEGFVKENAKEVKKYTNIKATYKTFPVNYFFEKSTKLKFDKPITKVSFNIKKGDVVTLLECDVVQEKFVSTKDQDLVLKGKIENTNKFKTYHSIYNYELLFDDIDIKEPYKTYTDIGGKWLCINDEKVAHLGNGFGDGTYTMRFSKGKLVR